MEGEGKVSAENVQQQSRFKRICVFCGSRVGYKSAFSDAALELGKFMVFFLYYLCIPIHQRIFGCYPFVQLIYFHEFCMLLFTCFLNCVDQRLKGKLIWFMEVEA